MSLAVSLVSGVDQQITLTNAQMARVLSIGTSWNSIRIGFRCKFSDLGGDLVDSPRFHAALISNPSGTPLSNGILNGDPACHAVGVQSTGTDFTYFTSYYQSAVGAFVLAAGTSSVSTTTPHRFGITGIDAVLFTVTKGSPNFTVDMQANGGSGIYGFTYAQLVTAMTTGTLSGRASFSRTVAVDEATNGYLNGISIAWSRPNVTASILEVLFKKIS